MDRRAHHTDVAVIGGAGFLGHHLCRHLAEEKVRVRAVDLRPGRPATLAPAAEYVGGCDATDIDQVTAAIAGCTAVINLVGLVSYWRQDTARLWTVNRASAATIAEACARAGVERFVHVSSSAALGFSNDPHRPIDEAFTFDWRSPLAKPYMVTKRAGEDAVRAAGAGRVSIAIANPAAMYGPGDVTNTARLFTAVRDGRVRIVPPGGNAVADVRDVARGLALLLDATGRSDQFLFVGANLTFVEIVESVGRAMGQVIRPSPLPGWARRPLCASLRVVERFLPRDRMVAPDDLELGFMCRYASASRAQRELGWSPQYTFQETVNDQAGDLRAAGLL